MPRGKLGRALATVAVLATFPIMLMVAVRLFLIGTHPTLIVMFLLAMFVSLMIFAIELDRTRPPSDR